MSEAGIGYGASYRIGQAAGPSPAFFDVGEVISVTPGEATADRVEVTHMKSPNRRREYISGLIDNGEAEFEINWVPGGTTDAFLREQFESGAVRKHQVEFSNGVTVTYDGSVIGFSKAVPIDDRMTATITVAVSGAEEWSGASSGGGGQ